MGNGGDNERAKDEPAERPAEPSAEPTSERARGELPAWVESGARSLRGSGRGTGAGMEFGAAIIFFTLLGLWIDRRCDTLPLFLLIGLALGFVGGFIHLVRTHGSTSSKRRPPR